jgi:hypothetical protein
MNGTQKSTGSSIPCHGLQPPWDIPWDISPIGGKMTCIQMYISIVYIDTYGIHPFMLLSRYAGSSHAENFRLRKEDSQWKNIEKQVYFGQEI